MMIEMKNNLKDKLRELTETHDMVSTYWKYAYLQLRNLNYENTFFIVIISTDITMYHILGIIRGGGFREIWVVCECFLATVFCLLIKHFTLSSVSLNQSRTL